MPDAAKEWTNATEDPSRLIAENERLITENNEWLRASRMLASGDEQQEIEAERIMDALRLGNHGICCPVPFAEVMEKNCAELRDDIKHVTNELTNALIREQELWAENRKLKDELEATPKWVPVSEFEYDSKFHIVWDSNKNEIFDAKVQKWSGKWFAAYSTEVSLDVTHVLVGLNPPVTKRDIDPRGDGDEPSGGEQISEVGCDLVRSEIPEKHGMEEGDTCNRDGCLGVIVLDPPKNCYCHISPPCGNCTDENRLHCDECLIAGSDLYDGDIEEAVDDADVKMTTEQVADAFDEMIEKAKQMDTIAVSSNDPAGDASDIERAIRERLLQPFLGSEAEKFGAKTYQPRDGEYWQRLCINKWNACNRPCWYEASQYRLAIRRVACKD